MATIPPKYPTVLLLMCILLAGCGSASDITETSTPETLSPTADDTTRTQASNTSSQVSGPEDQTATPTPAPPPGTDTRTVDDVQTLISAHYDVLNEYDYIVRYHYKGPDDLRDGKVAAATHVNRSGTISSNQSTKRQILDKRKVLSDGSLTNETEYTEDTITYSQYGAIGADGTSHDRYYTVTHWENTDFIDRHVTAFTLLTLTQYRLPAYDMFFSSNLTRTNVSTAGNRTYHTYRPSPENETSGFVRVREDGLMKTLEVQTTVDGHTVTLHRTYEVGPTAVDSPAWKQLAIIADQEPSGPSGDADCDDFSTQASAQAYHESSGDAGLDGDGDGLACEHLP